MTAVNSLRMAAPTTLEDTPSVRALSTIWRLSGRRTGW
jgi:hypothetical protein